MDSKRQLQVSEMIKRNFGPIFQQHGTYIYGDAFVTVTNVKMTPDLASAKIYVSIFNTNDKDNVLTRLSNHTHLLKQELAARIRNHVRRIPQIAFFMDETLDEMYRIDELFKKIQPVAAAENQEEE
ncbi:MAG: 30S ribosome-binding factor RbfA [Saprospiraceae bacterium]|nr:30S ribosome-binding factor RbfA [Saprospiraceae bacterium]